VYMPAATTAMRSIIKMMFLFFMSPSPQRIF
jgi:hypothetical protein